MDYPKLLIEPNTEYSLGESVTSLGRIPENDLPFPNDTNISRFHAEIEKRGDDYWLIDLNSSNGSSVNDKKISGEEILSDGDQINLGGSTKLEFRLTPKPEADSAENENADRTKDSLPEASVEAAPKPLPNQPPETKTKFPFLLVCASVMLALALLIVIGAALFLFTRETPKCVASAKILSPAPGDVIKANTPVEIEITNGDCVSKVSFQIEGKEFASATQPPFAATIDPNSFPEFGDGLNRNLTAVLYDENGVVISSSDEVAFFVETMQVSTPSPTPEHAADTQTGGGAAQAQATNAAVSVSETMAMTGNAVKQFTGGKQYKFDPQFLSQVQQRTALFASAGYFARAQKYRDVINVAFIQENSLDPPLGYVLAMSRSKYEPKVDNSGVGLWRLDPNLIKENAYDGMCGTETIESATQNCSAKASSRYLKDLILKVFEGDTVYGVAAFGMSPNQAEQWRNSLPANRADFWNVIKSDAQRQEIINFFAAAIVAENPQKFGLANDRPLSELYSVFMR